MKKGVRMHVCNVLTLFDGYRGGVLINRYTYYSYKVYPCSLFLKSNITTVDQRDTRTWRSHVRIVNERRATIVPCAINPAAIASGVPRKRAQSGDSNKEQIGTNVGVKTDFKELTR